jgi:transcriptional regulator with XRE-family HTH domain
MKENSAAALLQFARGRAGLSQRALAERSGTVQSVVARIELGITSPTWQTMEQLVGAAGFDLVPSRTMRVVSGSHMLDDVPRILALAPEDRLRELGHFSRLTASAQRV